MSKTLPMDPSERIGKLETAVAEIQLNLTQMRDDIAVIRDTVTKSKETNWGTVLAGVALVVGMYAAAVRPIEQELARQEVLLDKRGDVIQTLQNNQFEVKSRLSAVEEDMRTVQKEGAPITDRRLSVLEDRLKVQSR
jgi:hypothetical protein